MPRISRVAVVAWSVMLGASAPALALDAERVGEARVAADGRATGSIAAARADGIGGWW